MDVTKLLSLKDEDALVTDAGAGIGRAISMLFANAGAAVVVSDLEKDKATAVAGGNQTQYGLAIVLSWRNRSLASRLPGLMKYAATANAQ